MKIMKVVTVVMAAGVAVGAVSALARSVCALFQSDAKGEAVADAAASLLGNERGSR